MTHAATPSFWQAFDSLSADVRDVARKNFELLKRDPRHPSLHLKKVGRLWSVRVGRRHRALAVAAEGERLVWFWIGTHAEYDRMLEKR